LRTKGSGDLIDIARDVASFTGPSPTIPFEEGRLLLGAWQQVVPAEFDTRSRQREVIVQVTGEAAQEKTTPAKLTDDAPSLH
jgi:thiamine phosphate synthase YjbQ (UPF0047 family)